MMGPNQIAYYLAEHPSIVGFRWSHAHSLGSTWSFLLTSLAAYHFSSLALHLVLVVSRRRSPVPLGPLPALHSLLMSVLSAAIFLGTLLSSYAEIRDVRWSWRRSRTTPLQWLLCFPPGTRPSGRVFFWSYAFYLSRFLHLFRTFLLILRRRPSSRPVPLLLFSHSAPVLSSFLWLEFSQSLQVPAIASTSLASAVLYGYRFWVSVGLPPAACFPLVLSTCRLLLLCCHLVCHLGVLLLYFAKGGGCSGIGAWVFNSLLNGFLLLLLFVHCYVKSSKTSSLEEKERVVRKEQ